MKCVTRDARNALLICATASQVKAMAPRPPKA